MQRAIGWHVELSANWQNWRTQWTEIRADGSLLKYTWDDSNEDGVIPALERKRQRFYSTYNLNFRAKNTQNLNLVYTSNEPY